MVTAINKESNMVSNLDIDIKNTASLYRNNLRWLNEYWRFDEDPSMIGFIQWLSENNCLIQDMSVPPPKEDETK